MNEVPFAAEQPLYDVLDAYGIPFRSPMADLLAAYGSSETWSKGVVACEIADAKPLIDGLVGTIEFTWNERASVSQAAWPQIFSAYVRRSSDARVNFAWAAERLVSLFGEGDRVSTANTETLQWRFGEATVRANAFPAELQDPKMSRNNNRHKKVEGSATECRISITPRWAPLPTAEEHVAIESYVPVWPRPIPTMPAWQPLPTALTSRCYPAAARELPTGFGFDPGTKFLVRVDGPERVTIVATAQIIGVQCDNILPAKGSGGSRLDLEINQPHTRPARLHVASGAKPGGLDALASQLAERLGVPLTTNAYQDY